MKRITIKGLIKAIRENEKSIFDFEGFNSNKDKELREELLYRIREKYGSPNYSQVKREKIAGKNVNELKAYYMLTWGVDRELTMKEYCNNESLEEIQSKINYEDRQNKAINILLGYQ